MEKDLIRCFINAYAVYMQQYECQILSIEPEIKYERFGGGPSVGGGHGARAPLKSGPGTDERTHIFSGCYSLRLANSERH